jgi:saccharopine dehydrogenase (NAD+, L-lysine forming)
MRPAKSALRLWLRAETKPNERRAPLVPADVSVLTRSGAEIVVERCPSRLFSEDEYAEAGARLAEAGTWREAPPDAVVLGLKELPEDEEPLRHSHVYFAHAYKGQRGADALLARFARGGGRLLDLECLTDDAGRRVAAFGRWAGFAGAAVAVDVWAHQQLAVDQSYPRLESFADVHALLSWLERRLKSVASITERWPSVLVFGAKGRCGAGALDLLKRVGLDQRTMAWDKEETSAGGPFPQALERDIALNCVLLAGRTPPFLTEELLDRSRKLSVIADVSCDPYSPYNPLPIYKETTTFERPVVRLRESPPLDLTAIDHLPSLLPRESSEDFSAQLLPHLRTLAAGSPVWARAAALFQEKASAPAASR